MASIFSRRQFIFGIGASVAFASRRPTVAARSLAARHTSKKHVVAADPFTLAVITDEISQDFGHALEVAAKEFGLGFVELRELWGKNLFALDAKQVAEARALLKRFNLRVSSIASPIFKVDWPGAPLSPFSPKRDQFGARYTFEQQDELLERGFELARTLETGNLRIFDFWRLDDQKPYRAAIDKKLAEAAAKAGQHGFTLLLENEHACNTATGAEAARTLKAVPSPHLKLNWDPGNAAARGESPFPDGYALLPKARIGYMHCKDLIRKPSGGTEWAAMGKGVIDYVGQFRALKRDGYRGFLSLETHWRGGGTPEESSRQSMAGMKDLLRRAASA
ncbi:MAG TPA: sugar phosphate isomerase/epimerase family protein [Blastocatellia bacterium]|nr:sugar phosphate isomerase/epimerase family protein [Blastocatellia bacterium]